MEKEISISTSTILKILGIFVALGLVYLVRDIAVLLMLAIILVLIIEPLAARLEQKGIPRIFSVSITYLLGIAVFGAVLFFLIPPVISQLKQLIDVFPAIINRLSEEFQSFAQFAGRYNIDINLNKISSELELQRIIPNIFSTTRALISGIVSLVIILAISFYMSVEKGGLEKFINTLTPQKHREKISRLLRKIQKRLARWARGQLLVILIIGLLDYIGLMLLGVKFALLLGALGAILEIIPYAGPIIATIFAFVIGLSQSLTIGLLAGLWFLIVQQLENHVVTPKVMQSAVGLNPVIVILSILIGTKFFGLLGFILAVPVAAIAEVIISDFIEQKG